MTWLTMFHIRHRRPMRLAWLALMLVLAACNNGDNGGGGADDGGLY